MYQNDYIMRMIEDMSAFLANVVFHKNAAAIEIFDEQGNVLESGLLELQLHALIGEGRLNDAENLLFEKIAARPDPAYLPVARDFYAQLYNLSDFALERAGFSRDEIREGREDLDRIYQKGVEGEANQQRPADMPGNGVQVFQHDLVTKSTSRYRLVLFLANVRICGSKAFEQAYLLQKKAGFW